MKTFREYNKNQSEDKLEEVEKSKNYTLIINRKDFDKAVRLLKNSGISFGFELK